MTDPLKHSASPALAHLKFVKVHSPKMKSVYWRHFGFPLNEDNDIITKQSVVCTLCHKVLTNHGNTTNLRAHLQHRHKEIFFNICQENGIKVPPRKSQPKNNALTRPKREPVSPKIKVEYQQFSPNSGNMGGEEQAVLYETMVPMTYEDDEVIDTDNFTKVEVGTVQNSSGMQNRNNNNNCAVMLDTPKIKASNFAMMLDDCEEMNAYQLDEALVQLVVADLRNVDEIYDAGLSRLLRLISGKTKLPAAEKVEALIREHHSDKFTGLTERYKVHSQHKPFSLGFEVWTNVHQRSFLSVYFNYTTEAPEYNLIHQLYYTIEYNKFTSIDTLFEDINLLNCSAAIVNYDYDDYLKQFLQMKNIPVILSYDVTVDKCLTNIFNLPAVANIVEEVKDLVMHYAQEISSRDVEVPTLSKDFPWTNYEFLKFFTESVSWPDDMEVLVASAKSIVDTLSTLRVTLDTLKGEEIPHSSMISPITKKILSKKLCVADGDDELVAAIKQTITKELEKFVMADDHLTISALLDPRFHRLTNVENINSCVKILTEKYSKMSEIEGFDQTNERPTVTKSSQIMAKRSNLEMFFDIQKAEDVETPTEPGSVEHELTRFRREVFVNLDDSPFLWWYKMGHIYPALKQLALQYQCVPCVVNMNFKKHIKEQVNVHIRRHMLTGNLIDHILFLNHIK